MGRRRKYGKRITLFLDSKLLNEVDELARVDIPVKPSRNYTIVKLIKKSIRRKMI